MSKPRVSDADIITLRQRRKDGAMLKELAWDFRLSFNYVARICGRKDRKNVKAGT